MNLLVILAETTDAQPAANPIASLAPFLLIGLVFYFLIIRPQRKRQNEQKQLIKSLGVGDEIVTIGGFHGTIVGDTDTTFELEIADGLIVTIARNAVSKPVAPTFYDDEEDEFDADEFDDDEFGDPDFDDRDDWDADDFGDDDAPVDATDDDVR